MADFYEGITDQWGRRIEKSRLKEEIAAPSVSGVRSPLTGYPGDGLDPQRLANILREADQGDPLRFLELAETIEERDLHYAGVLGTRKRSVAQLDIQVDAASDDAQDVDDADMVREWIERDELQDELFDMLDAVGKGYSLTEIIWDTSEGQWRPQRLEWRDPRWFRPDRTDLSTPMLIGDNGLEEPIPAGKFIYTRIKAKSGLPIRSGIARLAAWAWMFKAYTQRDWAVFTQTFGQPVRVGRYGPNATKDDRDTLLTAVTNIAGDCAAIIPQGMEIEFIEAGNLGTGHTNYKERADWLDQQVSKGVLGQTTTTDAVSGGHAVSQEHRQVQEDIERADARTVSAVVNRDLIRPWVMLDRGPRKAYPRLRIARAEDEDVKALVENVERLVPLGLRVGMSTMRDKLGLPDPAEDEEVLVAPRSASPVGVPPAGATPEGVAIETSPIPAEAATTQPPRSDRADLIDVIAGAAARAAVPAAEELVARIRAIVEGSASLEEMRARLRASLGAPVDGPADLDAAMRQALLLAELTGRSAIDPTGDA
ncbi:MAG: DUF935 domain-containing protein [Nitratireductor sp.]|nr:DUF935 domain-containing protein [Nitratireductor sp.]